MVKKKKSNSFFGLNNAEQEIKEVQKEVHKEEGIIFHKFQDLKKHHQAIFALIIVTGVIFVWRGVWNLIDFFWLPKLKLWSSISGIVIGLIVLYLSHKLISHLAGN